MISEEIGRLKWARPGSLSAWLLATAPLAKHVCLFPTPAILSLRYSLFLSLRVSSIVTLHIVYGRFRNFGLFWEIFLSCLIVEFSLKHHSLRLSCFDLWKYVLAILLNFSCFFFPVFSVLLSGIELRLQN